MKALVKIIMPVAAFVLASAGAVNTGTTAKGEGGLIQGWDRIAPNDCVELTMCNNTSKVLCTFGGVQAYSKVGNDCPAPLFHQP
jgi:hypothetical protein